MTSNTEQFYIRCIGELEKQVAELIKINAALSKQVTILTDKAAKLSKNSSNSSNRPLSDLVNRLRKHGDVYFRFITTPGIGPTNNLPEQAICSP